MRKVSRGLLGYAVMIAVFIFLIVILSNGVGGVSRRIEYPELLQKIENEEIDRVSIRGNSLVGRYKNSKISRSDYPSRAYDFETTIGPDFYDTVCKMAAEKKGESADTISVNDLGFEIEYLAPVVTPWYIEILPYLIPMLLLVCMWWYIMRQQTGGGGKVMNFGKSRASMVDPSKNKVTFADVAGADEEKEELKEIVDFLKNPKRYVDLGARIPKGVLLVGPPGTGKTLLAKAVAGEADVSFLSISGSDFVEMYVGVGASRVRDLFEQAKHQSPAIVFIDEIDAVGRQRGSGLGGGHDEREQTLNQLLVEMDGFTANEGVVVLAATNRVDILDPALLRPGRFDRQVFVGLPDIKGRRDILAIHAKGKPLAEDVDLARVARATAGFTGADLENLLNEAALLTGRRGEKLITEDAIHQSVIKVIAGPEKHSRVIPEQERRLTAYHEAGHAVVIHALPHHDPVHQITIVPRGQSGGMTIFLPEEDRSYRSKSFMTEQIVSLLGGRAAEEMMLGDISTGASSDIQRATAIARKMVGTYGMSEKLGNVAFDAGTDEVFIGKSMGHTRPYSEQTAAEMDTEIRAIIDSAYYRCRTILAESKPQLEAVAAYLLEHETMDAEVFESYFPPKTPEE